MGLTLLFSAAGALPNQAEFAGAVQAHGLLPGLLANVYGSVLPWLELTIGVLLLVGLFTRFAAGVTLLMVISFLIANGTAVYQNVKNWDSVCGCFHWVAVRTGDALIIDIVLILFTVILVLRPQRLLSLDRRLRRMFSMDGPPPPGPEAGGDAAAASSALLRLHDDGRAVRQHLGHVLADLGGVVLHRDDRVGAHLVGMLAHPIERLGAGLVAQLDVLGDLPATKRPQPGGDLRPDPAGPHRDAPHDAEILDHPVAGKGEGGGGHTIVHGEASLVCFAFGRWYRTAGRRRAAQEAGFHLSRRLSFVLTSAPILRETREEGPAAIGESDTNTLRPRMWRYYGRQFLLTYVGLGCALALFGYFTQASINRLLFVYLVVSAVHVCLVYLRSQEVLPSLSDRAQ